MSTRYVWEKYEISYSTEQTAINEYNYPNNYIDNVAGYTASKIEITEDGRVNPVGTTGTLSSTGGTSQRLKPASPNIYFMAYKTRNTEYVENLAVDYNLYWAANPANLPGRVILTYYDINTEDWPKVGNMIKHVVKSEKGAYLGLASSNESGAFPSDGPGSGFWYVFQGSDVIDPLSVSYSTQKPERGEAVTVTLNPRANTLGGTVSYLYQYSTNGGSSWTSAGAETTAAEKAITVPANAEQFMVRVRASDDLGFTSADYVNGSNLEVQTMRLWAGVDNKARRGKKLHVGVDNKARRVVKAWIGVDNKARRWF